MGWKTRELVLGMNCDGKARMGNELKPVGTLNADKLFDRLCKETLWDLHDAGVMADDLRRYIRKAK